MSGVLQCLLFPGVALLGASGIVFMLIMLSSLAGISGGIPVTMLLVAALYLGDQIYAILFVKDNVANFMHIVGGVCGTYLSAPFCGFRWISERLAENPAAFHSENRAFCLLRFGARLGIIFP